MFFIGFSQNEKLSRLILLRFSVLVYWSSDEIQHAADALTEETSKLVTKDSYRVTELVEKSTAAVLSKFSNVATRAVSAINVEWRDRHFFYQHLLSTRAARKAAEGSTGGNAFTRGASVTVTYPLNTLRFIQAALS